MSYQFFESLSNWVEMQKKAKNTFENLYENVKKGDRLDLILATRAAFQHMIRTLKAFDSWLQDPLIISHMPREYLEEVWEVVYRLLIKLLELDIKHTSEFKDYLEKLQKEGKLNPLTSTGLFQQAESTRRAERRGVTLSM